MYKYITKSIYSEVAYFLGPPCKSQSEQRGGRIRPEDVGTRARREAKMPAKHARTQPSQRAQKRHLYIGNMQSCARLVGAVGRKNHEPCTRERHGPPPQQKQPVRPSACVPQGADAARWNVRRKSSANSPAVINRENFALRRPGFHGPTIPAYQK